jgi:pimeloyl-ACP methyl ester carboxylesterase
VNLQSLEPYRHTAVTRCGPVSYLDVGRGPTALFVHGVGTNAFLWRNVIDLLRGDYRCVALDLPLHGRTPASAEQDLTLPGLAAVVEALCDALELHQVNLVANDTGGAIAQIVAARQPRRLSTFTLTNCETHDNVPPEAFKPAVERAARGELSASAPQVMANIGAARSAVFGISYENVDRLSEDVVRSYLEPVFGAPERAREFERLLCSLRAEDLLAVEPRLRQLEVPTLVVWGTDDVFFDTRWAYWLRDTIPGATRVVELAGARLFFPDERAPEFATHLRQHWATHLESAQAA